MNLRSIDLNLLVVFDAVFQEKNITKAGSKIGLTQSSVSNALARLRGHLGDELFVRAAEGMRPTPRAVELAEPIRSTLFSLQNILDPKLFNPATESRVFKIAAVDYFSVIVAPSLAKYLTQNAPGVDVRIVSGANGASVLLDNGEVDFAVVPLANFADRFGSQLLISDTWVCMARKDHAFAGKIPDVKQFADAQHLGLSLSGDPHNFIDVELAKLGHFRRVAMTVDTAAVIPAIVEESDLVVTAPRRIIQRYASANSFIFDCPVPVPNKSIHLDLAWHKRLSVHPSQKWFKETLLNISSSL
jgi:DNA-binding transcriptional LysR family regulator